MINDLVQYILNNNSRDDNPIEILYNENIYKLSEIKLYQLIDIIDNNRYKCTNLDLNKWKITDYGEQVSCKLFYQIKYLCALLTFLIVSNYYLRIDSIFWIIHHIKRLYENTYINNFPMKTIPITNLYYDILYYGGFGLLLGNLSNYDVFNIKNINSYYYIIVLWTICQLCDGYCHFYLSKKKLFKVFNFYIYIYEIMSWILFVLLYESYNLYFIVKLSFCISSILKMFVFLKTY